jgi:hypothetical protein
VLGNEVLGRGGDDDAGGRDLVRRGVGVVAPGAHHLACAHERPEREAGEHTGAELVQLELELGDDAEVAAAAADAPQQVGVLLGARPHDGSVGEHDLGREEVVAGQAVLRRRPAVASAGGEAADPGGRDPAAGHVQAVLLCCRVELAPEDAAASARRLADRIDLDRLQPGEVDHDPAVADAVADHAVAAARARRRRVRPRARIGSRSRRPRSSHSARSRRDTCRSSR